MRTFHLLSVKTTRYVKLGLLSCLFSVGASHAQQPAQEPLLSRTQSVRPNLSVMFDDSGSMRWTCSYTRNVNAQVASTMGLLGINGTCRNVGNFQNTSFTARPAAGGPIYNSPANNELAYSPFKRYQPPFVSPTARALKAPIADNFPLAANLTLFRGTAPLLLRAEAADFTAPTEDTTATVEPTAAIRIFHIPRTNFSVATANLAALENLSNYDSYGVGANSFYVRAAAVTTYVATGAINPLPKPTARTDCTAAARCTIEEERQNIANWHLFYRDRFKAFRSGVAEAFNGLPDSFRLNYSTLGLALTRINSNGDRVVRNADDFRGISTMTDYGIALPAFYTWLYATNGNGFNVNASIGTPLRQAYDRLARSYLENTSNSGPWGNTPWSPGAELASSHLSCRKSFAILATDGYWNNSAFNLNTPAVIANTDVDSQTGPLIGDNPNGVTYQYAPGAADIWAKGKRDNSSSNNGNQATLADLAHYYWINDLRATGAARLQNNVTNGSFQSGPFWQNLNLTTVAFGANGLLSDTINAPATSSELQQARSGTRNWPTPAIETATALDDLAHAAHNAGGDFLAVSDAQTFAERLRNRLLDIASEELSQAGVVGSSQSLSAGAVKIEANFVSGKWWGNLSAITLDPVNGRELGAKWRVVGINNFGQPTGTTTIPTPNAREIYTYVDASTAPIPFTHTALTASTNGLIGSANNQLTSTWSSDQTDFIRGVRVKEGDEQPFRARDTILGDIVNSTPAFVKNTIPSTYSNRGSASDQLAFKTYRANKAARTNGLILVGANDGMLHAFREQDGAEIFAYVPRAVLGHLHLLTQKDYALKHRYYVDGPLNEIDAYIQTPNASGAKTTRWSNLVLGSTGAGAKAVFAIDVTETGNLRNDDILWEINSSQASFSNDLGFVTARVQGGVTASGDWVGIFSNGAGSTSGLAKLFIVNLQTGALIKSINTDASTNNGLGGVRLVRNISGAIIGAYAGDLKGRMWRFDLSAAASSAWPNSGEILFTAPNTTASGTTTIAIPSITGSPAVVKRTDNRDGYMVVFGTGRLLYNSDLSTPHPLQRAYGVWDTAPFGGTTSFVPAQYSDLVPSIVSVTSSVGDVTDTTFFSVSTAGPIDWTTKRGWYMDLTQADGQRLLYPADILNGLVQLQTVAPRANTANSCINDGIAKGFNFVIDPTRGGCRNGKTLDTNQRNSVDNNDSNACGLSTIGDGENENFCKGDCNSDPTSKYDNDSSIIQPPQCENEVFTSVDTTTRAQDIKTCDKPLPPGETGVFRRTMRQVFIRP